MLHIKKISKNGIISIPKKLRLEIGINEGDTFEIIEEMDGIKLKRHYGHCSFCESDEDISYFKGRAICGVCKKEMRG